MLQVHSSNHLESLLDQLLTCINQGDPFCAEVIVVENPGMSRWLQQQIAAYDGISANLRFVSPAQFIWESAQCWITQLDPTAMADIRAATGFFIAVGFFRITKLSAR